MLSQFTGARLQARWRSPAVPCRQAPTIAVLDNAHLMRLAGRFARRVRAWAAANAVPVIVCPAGERKHLIAEEYCAPIRWGRACS